MKPILSAVSGLVLLACLAWAGCDASGVDLEDSPTSRSAEQRALVGVQPAVDATKAVSYFYSSFAAPPPDPEECCTQPGQIEECWFLDAARDGVACADNGDCPSNTCDIATGLCTCINDDDCNDGVCTSLGLCGPSYCNGVYSCTCAGGCVYQPPQDIIPCSLYGLNCCDGPYPTVPSGDPGASVGVGYCTAEATCGGCAIDDDCDDGNPCTVGERCVADQCTIGTPLNCDDGSVCTTDVCNPASILPDPCVHVTLPCSDGDNCTVDACDPVTGCASAPKNCSDANACSADTCNAVSGACEHTVLVAPVGVCCDPAVLATFDDANVCTIDACNGSFQDVNANLAPGAMPIG
ncbi:MAG: hypothetical protein MUC50_24230, partial [Myxococcota bacterium]|nr:hypothetical protein [Myxococcota bacterium]